MKAIKRTKQPTLKQMQNMASNLQEKYGLYSIIQIDSHKFSSNHAQTEYWISVQTVCGQFLKSWEAVLDKYEELMEDKDA